MKSKKRILLVDDNIAIHEDFKQILNSDNKIKDIERLVLEHDLFNDSEFSENADASDILYYDIDDAYQGEEAIRMVDEAVQEKRPYSLVFMDVRMPPGIDGIKAIQNIWQKHPHIEIVICTAHSDYSWDEILAKFGSTDHLLFIQKPFNSVTIKQIALTMTTKWELNRQNRDHIKNLEKRIAERTKDLQMLIKEKEIYINNIRDEMTLAEIVQQQLLPTKLPEFKTTDIAALYIPTEKIGGDFYDVIPLSDEKVAFIIFDVSGHGIAAALVTAIGKFSFRQHLNESRTPGKVLELVNKDIFESTPPQMYITAFLMIYNLRSRELFYSGAGHIPQLYYRAEDNALEEMLGKGLFLGIDDRVCYKQYERLRLNKGDKILLYTDGLTETFNNNETMYGKDRIKKLVLKSSALKCEKLLKRIIRSNKIFMEDQKRGDDVCVLAIDIK